MRRLLPILAMLVMGLAPAPVFRPKPMSDDQKAMQGIWVRESVQNCPAANAARAGGGPMPVVTWTIAGEHLTTSDGSTDTGKGRFVLHEAKTPRGFFIPLPTPVYGVNQIKAIYTVNKNVLVVCYDPQRWDRSPTGFPAPGDKNLVLQVFKRKKP